jgi:hypothetical protein
MQRPLSAIGGDAANILVALALIIDWFAYDRMRLVMSKYFDPRSHTKRHEKSAIIRVTSWIRFGILGSM